jgi:hypothetical protein
MEEGGREGGGGGGWMDGLREGSRGERKRVNTPTLQPSAIGTHNNTKIPSQSHAHLKNTPG